MRCFDRILQNYQPDLEVANEEGHTCLHLAAKNKSENIVGLLIEHALARRVSIRLAKLKDLNGNTAMALAKKLAPIKDKHGKKKMAGAARGVIERIKVATKREASLNAVRKQLDKVLNRVTSHVPGKVDADGVPKLLPRHHRFYAAQAQGLLGVDGLARVQHSPGLLHAEQAHQVGGGSQGASVDLDFNY